MKKSTNTYVITYTETICPYCGAKQYLDGDRKDQVDNCRDTCCARKFIVGAEG